MFRRTTNKTTQRAQHNDNIVRLHELSRQIASTAIPQHVVDVLLHNTRDIVLIINAQEGIIQNISSPLASALNTTIDELRGKTLSQIMQPDDIKHLAGNCTCRLRYASEDYVYIKWTTPVCTQQITCMFGEVVDQA